MQPISRLHAHLKRLGKSHTQQRDEVYIMLSQLGPCTKPDLARALAGSMDQATVYRTINFFLEAGVAQVIRYRLVELSDNFKQHHHHFSCSKCGREISFNSVGLERALAQVANEHNLKVESHQVELSGRCGLC